MIFVLIQILCDKKYKCKKNNPSENDSSFSDSNQNNQSLISKRKEKISREKDVYGQSLSHEQVTFDQPKSPSFCPSHSCIPTETNNVDKKTSILRQPQHILESVNFNNQTSTLKFPPSFNLKKDQKSTPIRSSTNLNCTCQIDKDSFTPNCTPTTTKKSILSKQNQFETKVDIHETDNQTFESNDLC